jgi:hypothetical protein
MLRPQLVQPGIPHRCRVRASEREPTVQLIMKPAMIGRRSFAINEVLLVKAVMNAGEANRGLGRSGYCCEMTSPDDSHLLPGSIVERSTTGADAAGGMEPRIRISADPPD